MGILGGVFWGETVSFSKVLGGGRVGGVFLVRVGFFFGKSFRRGFGRVVQTFTWCKTFFGKVCEGFFGKKWGCLVGFSIPRRAFW